MEGTQNLYCTITPQQARQMMCDIAVYTVLIDVRRKDEFSIEHIKGAVNIPLGQLAERIGQVVPDKNQEIILYCLSGSRSMEAANELISMGYHNVFDLGGISDWQFEKETSDI